MDLELVLRQAVAPVAVAYFGFLWAALAHMRRGRWRGRSVPVGVTGPGERAFQWRSLLAATVPLAAGGYATFVAIVVVFYFVLGDQAGSFITEALVEGSLLAAATVPAFLLLSGGERAIRRWREGRSG
jgi:hypothetical protein